MFDTFTKKCTRNYTAAYTIDLQPITLVVNIHFYTNKEFSISDVCSITYCLIACGINKDETND